MKKSLLLLLTVVSLLAFSCSKDAKINRRLNGEWNVSTIDNVPMGVDESYTFNFVKEDKLTGTGIFTLTWSGASESLPFTYSIGTEKMIINIDGDSEVFTVMKYDKDRIELMDSWGDLWVLDPK